MMKQTKLYLKDTPMFFYAMVVAPLILAGIFFLLPLFFHASVVTPLTPAGIFLPDPLPQVVASPAYEVKTEQSQETSSEILAPKEERRETIVFENTTHLYSSVDPFNSDETLILVSKPQGFLQVRNTRDEVVKDDLNRFGILPGGDPLWSSTDPNSLYFHTVEGNAIKSFNVKTGEVKLLHTFSQYKKISFGNGEGDLAGDVIPIVADEQFGILFDAGLGSFTKAVNLHGYTNGAQVDVFDVTHSGEYVVLIGVDGGTHIFDQNMNYLNVLVEYGGHSDRGVDAIGNDALVITNSNDPTPILNCENGIVKVSIPDGQETCLLELDWSLAVHISCNAAIPWCLVSTYGDADESTSLSNELFLISLKDGSTISLGKSGTAGETYEKMPRAAISGDANFIIFDSDKNAEVVSSHVLFISGIIKKNY
jgi:hypothetical protein